MQHFYIGLDFIRCPVFIVERFFFPILNIWCANIFNKPSGKGRSSASLRFKNGNYASELTDATTEGIFEAPMSAWWMNLLTVDNKKIETWFTKSPLLDQRTIKGISDSSFWSCRSGQVWWKSTNLQLLLWFIEFIFQLVNLSPTNTRLATLVTLRKPH